MNNNYDECKYRKIRYTHFDIWGHDDMYEVYCTLKDEAVYDIECMICKDCKKEKGDVE